METFREKIKLILFSKNTTAFWNFLTKPTGGRFSKEIPKRCCNQKILDQKKSVFFCLIFLGDKTIFQKKSDHLYRSHFFSRFRKSHLEQRAIFLNIRKTRPKKCLFFRAIFHLAALRLVNLLYKNKNTPN